MTYLHTRSLESDKLSLLTSISSVDERYTVQARREVLIFGGAGQGRKLQGIFTIFSPKKTGGARAPYAHTLPTGLIHFEF